MGLLNRLWRWSELPGEQWQAELDRARADIDALAYPTALERLRPLARQSATSPSRSALAALTQALVGECLFQLGRADEAVAPTRQALERTRALADEESRLAYLGNLYEIERYRGRRDESVRCAFEMADLLEKLGRTDEGAHYRAQAVRVQQGEPLLRIVIELGGARRELEEVLQGQEGAVRFVPERNRLTLRPCEALVAQGEAQAQTGKFEEALGLYHQAAAADAYAPQPHYHAGLVLLHLARPVEAAQALSAAEERAPGWFLTRPAAWLAEQLRQGTLPPAVIPAWHALEESPLPPERKLDLVQRTLPLAPQLALLHLLHGLNLKARGTGALAESAFRRGLRTADEPDTHTRLLVALASVVDRPEERRQLLERASTLGGNLVAAATARLVLGFEPGERSR